MVECSQTAEGMMRSEIVKVVWECGTFVMDH